MQGRLDCWYYQQRIRDSVRYLFRGFIRLKCQRYPEHQHKNGPIL